MKRVGFAFALLSATFLWAAPEKPIPADFGIKVHVVTSGWQVYCVSGLCAISQLLETEIDGQSVQLQQDHGQATSPGILTLGDYPARVSASIHGPKNANNYDIYRGYDLLMPDGTARTYTVTRLGRAPSNP